MLNRMLNVAVQWGYLDKNPFQGVVIKKLPTGDYMQRFLSLNEIKSLLSACKRSKHPYLHLFVKLLLLTGARKSELRLAKWTSIDEQKGELFVAVSKSGRSRTIVLSKKALDVLVCILHFLKLEKVQGSIQFGYMICAIPMRAF